MTFRLPLADGGLMLQRSPNVARIITTLVVLCTFALACRAEQPTFGTAGLMGKRTLDENDSVSITNVSKATMLDDGRIAICEVITNRILLYDVKRGKLLAATSAIPSIRDSLYADYRLSYIDSIYPLQPPDEHAAVDGQQTQPFLGYHTFAITERNTLAALLQYDYPVRLRDGRMSVFPLIALVELSPTDLRATRCTGIKFTRDVWARRYALATSEHGQHWISATSSSKTTSKPFVMCRYDQRGEVVNTPLETNRVVLPQNQKDASVNSVANVNPHQFVRTSYRSLVIVVVQSADGSVRSAKIPSVVTEQLQVQPDQVLISDPARLSDSTFAILVWRSEDAGERGDHDCVLVTGMLQPDTGAVTWRSSELVHSNDPITTIIEPVRARNHRKGNANIQVIAVSANDGPYIASIRRIDAK